MNAARLRLLLAAILFAAWIGWLAYLAVTASRPVVLSRPQFLASRLDVVAFVRAADSRPDPRVTVREVVRVQADSNRPAEGEEIVVTNLPDSEGWSGPGEYILPLVPADSGFQVAPIPRSPGYEPGPGQRPRIYPATPETRRQLAEIHAWQ